MLLLRQDSTFSYFIQYQATLSTASDIYDYRCQRHANIKDCYHRKLHHCHFCQKLLCQFYWLFTPSKIQYHTVTCQKYFTDFNAFYCITITLLLPLASDHSQKKMTRKEYPGIKNYYADAMLASGVSPLRQLGASRMLTLEGQQGTVHLPKYVSTLMQ